MTQSVRYGIWINRYLWPDDADIIASAAAELEQLGYGAVWVGASPADDLDLLAAILAATSRITVGTSIVDIWSADGHRLAASHARIAHQFPGRFRLGVGAGHASSAEAKGATYDKPLTRLRSYLTQELGAVPASQKMIAALGPRALETARDLTAGALPYLTPPAHTADARAILGPDSLLIPEQKVFLGTDPAVARAVGRARAGGYLSLPNYTRMLRRYGMTDADLAGAGSDRFVDSAVAWGSAAAVKAAVDAHLEAGADQVALQVLSADPEPHLPRAQWRAMAAALFG